MMTWFFLFQCCRSDGHNDEKLGSLSSCFFFGSNFVGPQCHNDEEFNSLSSCFFVLVLHIIQTHDNEELNFSSSRFFVL